MTLARLRHVLADADEARGGHGRSRRCARRWPASRRSSGGNRSPKLAEGVGEGRRRSRTRRGLRTRAWPKIGSSSALSMSMSELLRSGRPGLEQGPQLLVEDQEMRPIHTRSLAWKADRVESLDTETPPVEGEDVVALALEVLRSGASVASWVCSITRPSRCRPCRRTGSSQLGISPRIDTRTARRRDAGHLATQHDHQRPLAGLAAGEPQDQGLIDA